MGKSRTSAYYGGGSVVSNKTGTTININGDRSRFDSYIGTTTSGPPYTANTYWNKIESNLKPGRVKEGGSAGVWGWKWNNVPFPPFPGDGQNDVDTMSLQVAVNKALSQTNPNKPIVNLPLFLWELRELPMGIRKIGTALQQRGNPNRTRASSDPGSAYLAWKFGWAPLISDLNSLFSLASSIEKRVKRLNEGHRRQTIRGKLPGSKWSSSRYMSRKYYTEIVGFTLESQYTVDKWYTMQYELATPLPSLNGNPKGSSGGMKNYLTSSSIDTLWNAIPWTWLVDYFISVGDYLQATQGNLGFESKHLCVMTQTSCSMHSEPTKVIGNWATGPVTKNGGGSVVRKKREVVPIPKARITYQPFLQGGQIGILAALASSRTSKFLRSI